MAAALHHCFDHSGYNPNFLQLFNNSIFEEAPDAFRAIYRSFLSQLVNRIASASPFEHNAMDLLMLLEKLIADERIKPLVL